MRYGSVCSGIEAATVALHPLGWEPAWFSEIEPFPSRVLAHHYPDVVNLGDMTALPMAVLRGAVEAPDVLIGGTPCQAFSVAGMREGLADARGLLTIRFVELADAIDIVRARRGDPASIVWWENVPGVLSQKQNAFGCFLAAVVGESEALLPPGKRWTDAGCVYGPRRAVAWRVLDAQYFGLAQRRRRVFVVASARAGFDPAAVLFEREGVRRDSAPRRETREAAPGTTARSVAIRGRDGVAQAELGDDVANTILTPNGGRAGIGCGASLVPAVSVDLQNALLGDDLCGTLTAEGERRGNRGQSVLVPPLARCDTAGEGRRGDYETCTILAFDTTQITNAENRSNPKPGDPCHPLAAGAHPPAIAFDCKASGQSGFGVGDIASTMRAMGHSDSHQNGGGHQAVALGMVVRRLTPRECERLQGFDDDHTKIPWNGWRKLGDDESPELLAEQGYTVKQNKKSGKWRVKDVDGPRYKALGNSMPTYVIRWLGRRIASGAAA